MAVYSQVAYHPIIFQVGENNLGSIKETLESKSLNFRKTLLLTGGTYSLEISKSLKLSSIEKHLIIDNNSFSEVERLSQHLYNNNYDLIIGLGGGKVQDVTKRVSLLQRINHISIPTIISNDGLISPISVLRNSRGFTESIPGQMPMGVIIDLNVISSSPVKYIKAAAGDILSNMSATNDWIFASNNNHERINDIGFQLSRMSAHSLIHFDIIDVKSKEFLKMIIQGQVNSGIAMALSGTSRPCSGSEHLLSHAIDYLKLSCNSLHGLQVGSLSLFCLFLQEKLKPVHIKYAERLDLPLNFFDDDKFSHNQMEEVFIKSRDMRPGRRTILDKYSNEELIEKYKKYLSFVFKTELIR